MIRRLLIGAALIVVVGAGGLAIWMRVAADEPARWHVALRDVARSGAANDFLAATPGFVTAQADVDLPAPEDGEALLAALDRIALGEPRTRRVAGSPEEGRITWVQRSAVFGFPDYITAEAGPEGWAIWSRARYGESDFGMNRARVERWLAALK